jgi:hypothetical protein
MFVSFFEFDLETAPKFLAGEMTESGNFLKTTTRENFHAPAQEILIAPHWNIGMVTN